MRPVLVLMMSAVMGILPAATIASAQPPLPEVAPEPHLPASPLAIAAVKGGYQITLNRASAEQLCDTLAQADEKEIAAALRKIAKDRKDGAKNPDDQTAATLEMIAFVVSSQAPGFKKALAEKMGPGGAVITLTGLQAPVVKFSKPRPRLEKALEAVRGAMPLLPDDAREAVETLRAVARTTPLFWKVEPRE
jgi:hypothetical protein